MTQPDFKPYIGSDKSASPDKRRLPAEWEAQSSILLTWPHKNTDWQDQLQAVDSVYFNIAKAILSEQDLIISCEDDEQLKTLSGILKPYAKQHHTLLKTYSVPANDTWTRDHGPIGIIDQHKLVLLDFNFNAWGGKYKANKDNEITRKLVNAGAFREFEHQKVDFILEGGSIESDGKGTLLTTERCLLTNTRNDSFNKQTIEAQLKLKLGVKQILWLKHGFLAGDDTDAHIDTLARFCDAHTICYVACEDPNDEHYTELALMEQELQTFKNNQGQPYKLVPLPMPTAIYETDEQHTRLPATYANFLITNQSILLPVYDVPEDEQAIKTIQQCFPDRNITPINCRPLIKEHGSLHCITMQITQGLPLEPVFTDSL